MIGAAGFLTAKARELAGMEPQPDAPASCQGIDAPIQTSRPDYGRLSVEDHLEIIRLNVKGLTQRKIAEIIGCSQQAVCEALKRMSDKADVVQALLKAQSVTAAHEWGKAVTKAAERGDHRPARELIEAAHPELRPQQGNAGAGGGVTILIGMPGQPLALPVIEVSPQPVAAIALSPAAEMAVSDESDEAKGPPIGGVSPNDVA